MNSKSPASEWAARRAAERSEYARQVFILLRNASVLEEALALRAKVIMA